jgi:hypothetical protein
MIYRLSYEYNAQRMGGEAFILAQNWGEARDLAIAYLTEEHLWHYIGTSNMTIERQTHFIPPGSLLLYRDDEEWV